MRVRLDVTLQFDPRNHQETRQVAEAFVRQASALELEAVVALARAVFLTPEGQEASRELGLALAEHLGSGLVGREVARG